MDALNICNKIRMVFEGVPKTMFPLDAFPAKIQELALDLLKYENFPIEYTVASFLSAVATAIGNSYQIRIKGNWTSSPILYIILVGRPGVGKTPPLDFAYKPIRKQDAKKINQFKIDMEAYERTMEEQKGRKSNEAGDTAPERPILQRTIISDFTPEALMRAHDTNARGIVVYVDEIMGMFNTVNQYNRGQLIEQLLTAHSGKAIDITRCNMPIPIHIEQPCINIVGTTQTKRIHELFDKGYNENGLIDRILFVYPKEHEIPDWQIDNSIDKRDYEKPFRVWESVINRILDLKCNINPETDEVEPTLLKFSEEAQAYFIEWRNKTTRAINQIADDASIDNRVMKTPLNTARLAMVIQLLGWACGDVNKDFVDIDSVKAAISLNDYFEDSYSRLKEFLLKENIDLQKEDLLESLEKEFKTADAIQAGKSLGLSERTIMYTIRNLASNHIIKKTKHGEYEKLQ